MRLLWREVAAVVAAWLVRRLGGWGVEVPAALAPEVEAWLRLSVEILLELLALWLAARLSSRRGAGGGFAEFSPPAPGRSAPRIGARCRRRKG